MNKLTRFNKAIGAILGGILGLLVAYGLLPDNIADQQFVQEAITILASVIGTYLAPKNKESETTESK